MPYWREGGGGGHYKKHTMISVLGVCVVLCTLSDNTYVHVHVCGSARSGGGAHMKWTCHMEATSNIFAPPLEVLGHDVATHVEPKPAPRICHVLCTCHTVYHVTHCCHY